jgi:DNA excision repair protein ERCC-3
MSSYEKPIWIFADGYLIFETFTGFLEEIQDFLVTISEPVIRTTLIHEYILTPYALYAAVTSGVETMEIIYILETLSKNFIPTIAIKMISLCTNLYRKLHLILFKNVYYIYSPENNFLKIVLGDNVLRKFQLTITTSYFNFLNIKSILKKNKKIQNQSKKDKIVNYQFFTKSEMILSINPLENDIELFRRRCIKLDCPLLEEYDFRNDTVLDNIPIDLISDTKIRKYQEKALSKMFHRGRARSGVIVLPCGAGKTIVGITISSIIKKPALVICNSTVSVDQWRKQFLRWSDISEIKIRSFIAGYFSKSEDVVANIIVTTYSMISFGGRRAKLSASLLGEIKEREWGIVILDEVHVVPANVFRKVLGAIKTHCKLGLTATLLREDRKVGDIGFLIGPKLYEANWLDLEKTGYLAKACCAEICCTMPSKFYERYLSESSTIRQILCALNPNKAKICDFLVRYHEDRGDRILVFSDNVFALRSYATKMTRSFIYGATGAAERMKILKNFQEFQGQTLFISRIGDTSIDLPEANVIIQISSHYGSRRQEAQRLGRILRPKFRSQKAFFYSLVSANTEEMFYAAKRQQFLISQGYDFKTVIELNGINMMSNLVFDTKEEEEQLLNQILSNQNRLDFSEL